MMRGALLLLATLLQPALGAEVTATAFQPEVARLVADFMGLYHYDRRPLDDRMSRRWLTAYIEGWDPQRMYFLESDIEEFAVWDDRLDDLLRAATPRLQPAFAVFNTYQRRVSERIRFAQGVLKGELDLTVDESRALDRSKARFAAGSPEIDELWRKRVKDDVLGLELAGRSRAEAVELLGERYERIGTTVADLDAVDVLERYLEAFTTSFDPHSTYFKPVSRDNFEIGLTDALEGIGARLQTEGEYTEIVELIPGGPADLSDKLTPGDRIVAVGQDGGEPVDVVGLRIDRVVQLIRGKKGSVVDLTILPAEAVDTSKTHVISLQRDRVVLSLRSATSEVRDVDGAKVAVIDIPSFLRDEDASGVKKSTTQDVARLLAELPADTAAVVIDLRHNGGGSLSEAIELSGLFIDRGPVVQVRDREGAVEVLEDEEPGAAWSGPLVVLTSPISASASEIFAGAIQDYDRGVVVGSRRTFGKGTVQQLVGLAPALDRRLGRAAPEEDVAGALKFTTAKFYRVSGGSTQFKGVESDVVVPSPFDALDLGEDTLDHALPYDTIAPRSHVDAGSVHTLVGQIRERSAARIGKDPGFKAIEDQLRFQRELEVQNTVSLNLAQRKAEQERAEARAEQWKEALGDEGDPVLDEAVHIGVDLAKLGPA